MKLIDSFLSRRAEGFTIGQKLGWTFLTALYAVWPVDVLPDFLPAIGQLDDVTAFIMLVMVWFSPRRRKAVGA
ncbi:MAG: YkvA family protein [Phycisphaerales bacterium]